LLHVATRLLEVSLFLLKDKQTHRRAEKKPTVTHISVCKHKYNHVKMTSVLCATRCICLLLPPLIVSPGVSERLIHVDVCNNGLVPRCGNVYFYFQFPSTALGAFSFGASYEMSDIVPPMEPPASRTHYNTVRPFTCCLQNPVLPSRHSGQAGFGQGSQPPLHMYTWRTKPGTRMQITT